MSKIKLFLDKNPLDSVNRRLHKMKPEDITDRVQREWRSYVKWRRRRRRLSSWYLNKVHPSESVDILIFLVTLMLCTIGMAVIVAGLILVAQSIFSNLLVEIISSVLVIFSLSILVMIKLLLKGFDIHVALYSSDMDRKDNSMRAFFELHPHNLIAELYKPVKKPNLFEKHYDDLDYDDMFMIDELPEFVYSDIPSIDKSDDFQKTETIEEEDSTSYGTMKLLYNLFIHLLNVNYRGSLYRHQNWSAKTKTLELIHLMWNKNHVPLTSSKRETGLLVRAWSDMLSGKIGWKEYYGMVDAMMARVGAEASTIEERDKSEVIDRLMKLKHDSDVMNDSQSLARMRDLVGRLHESSAELVGRTVS